MIGETEVLPRATGLINRCSWGVIADWASIIWTGVLVGTHDYLVKVDSHNSIEVESDEMDNRAKAKMTVEAQDPKRLVIDGESMQLSTQLEQENLPY